MFGSEIAGATADGSRSVSADAKAALTSSFESLDSGRGSRTVSAAIPSPANPASPAIPAAPAAAAAPGIAATSGTSVSISGDSADSGSWDNGSLLTKSTVAGSSSNVSRSASAVFAAGVTTSSSAKFM